MAKSSRPTAGRRREKELLLRALASPDPELIAVYGRRRVGKTHLVREVLGARAGTYFAVTGQHDAPMAVQLGHFQRELERVFYANARLPQLRSWEEGFDLLASNLEAGPRAPVVVFLDELPWLATRRSRLLPTLDHCWNTRLSRLDRLCFVVCGSAASFMLDKLIHAKGGLHNRVTQRLRVDPLELHEVEELLQMRGVKLGRGQILELYLALGGVPHYLMRASKGRSAAQVIAELCFDKAGLLRDEYDRLFRSLFRDAEAHDAIVRALRKKWRGMTRGEIATATGLSSGGRLAARLSELEEAGFVAKSHPHGRRTKDTRYRLIDELVTFHLTWIERARALPSGAEAYWLAKSRTPSYRAWAGYAFEAVCLKHTRALRRALRIDSLAVETAGWRYLPPAGEPADTGAQIDLLFDRDDGVITLCEMKYSSEPFKLDKRYARALEAKRERFIAQTGTRKDVQIALVTPRGLAPSLWAEEVVDNVVDLDDLFSHP